ncbi:MAG: polysaccharide deacetylase family protein [Spirochaetes bacterium]|nr:polysaccharide deacetylase family protein [Spirochaetota bacterium]
MNLMLCLTAGMMLTSLALGETITLDAASATGGAKNKEGDTVYLTAAMGVKDEVRWEFASELPAGAWKVTVDFNGKTGGAKNQHIGFVAGRTPLVDCYYINTSGKQSFAMFTAMQSRGMLYRKSSQRGQDTAGIRSVSVEPLDVSATANMRWYLDCPVDGGSVTLPVPLAPGRIRASFPAKVSATWQCGERSFTTPAGTQAYLFLSSAAERITVDGTAANVIIERHPVEAVPAMPVENGGELIQTIDTAKTETRTITLVGYSGGAAPSPAVFPYGKKYTIFTTWDDGRDMDMPLAETMKKHGFRGTFFMNRNSQMLAKLAELEALGMEIGNHSWNHPAYYLSGYERCYAETANMRRLLEGMVGHPVISFGYPFNYSPAYDEQGDYVVRSVSNAGIWSARGTATGPNYIDEIKNPYGYTPDFHFNTGAERISARFKELTVKDGLVFHVWGHSYELAGSGMATLEKVLASLEGNPDIWYTTAGEVYVWRWMRMNTQVDGGKKDANGVTFTMTRPWLHPYLRTFPLTLKVPEGVTEIVYNGERRPVKDGLADIMW